MANFTLFGDGPQTMAASNDFTPLNVGTAFYLVNEIAGWRAAGARFYLPSIGTLPTTGYKAYLWSGNSASSATLLAQADFAAVTSGWNQVLFTTPVALASFPTAGEYYWVSVYFPGGGYYVVDNKFATSVVSATTPNLVAADYLEVVPGNGAFAYGAAGAPMTGGSTNKSWYGVDVIVDDGTTDVYDLTTAGSSAAGITDSVVAIRSGGPTSVNISATATDPLNVVGSDAQNVVMSGDSRRTNTRSMWQDRTNYSSMEFTNTVYGPELNDVGESVEVGVVFSVQRPVRITGINIYKHPNAQGSIPVTLWDFAGNILAQKTVSWNVDGGGWVKILFDAPVDMPTETHYIASYYAANGRWAYNPWVYNGMFFYEWPFVVGTFSASGVDKTYGSRVGAVTNVSTPHQFPRTAWHGNYYVDPIAEWDEAMPGPGAGVDYLKNFPNGGFSHGYPLAVYYPDPPFIEDYMSIGVNTAVGVPIDVAGYRDVIVSSGMDIYSATTGGAAAEFFVGDPALAARVKGYSLWDEPDMVHNGATPQFLRDRINSIRRVDSTRPVDLNLGMWPAQGISFQWWPVGASVETVTENWRGYGEIPDFISCDWYAMNGKGNERWGTWVYPKQVQKMRQISDGRLPVWAYIESCPIQNGSRPTAIEVKNTAWACIIAGASGIVFFDHQFPDAEFPTQDFAWSLHNPSMRAGITELATQIQSVASAIQSAEQLYVTNVLSSNSTAGPRGGTYGVPIHHTGRQFGAYRYVFAQAIRPGSTVGTFTIPAAASKTITVLDESRTIAVNSSGVFTDSFNGDYEYHLYRWAI